jgi:hypothetical protein
MKLLYESMKIIQGKHNNQSYLKQILIKCAVYKMSIILSRLEGSTNFISINKSF